MIGIVVTIFGRPQYTRDYFEAREYKNIFVSGVDAYNLFTAFAEKT